MANVFRDPGSREARDIQKAQKESINLFGGGVRPTRPEDIRGGDPTKTPPPVRPEYPETQFPENPLPENPCIDLHNYGHVLWERNFQWKDEVKAFLESESVTKVAAFSDIALEYVVELRNAELSAIQFLDNPSSSGTSSTTLGGGRTGRRIDPFYNDPNSNNTPIGPTIPTNYDKTKYEIVCTGYFIKDYLCDVKNVKYFQIGSLQTAFARYTFNVPELPYEYYITSGGKICRLIPIRDTEDVPDLGDPVDPPVGGPLLPPLNSGPNLGSGQVFSALSVDDMTDVVEVSTSALWSQNSKYLSSPTTASLAADTGSANYCVEVYNLPPSDPCTAVQYKCIYADYEGKGDKDLGGKDNETITKAMYTQYANILLPKGQEKFIIDGNEEDYVYILDIKRDRFKQIMDPGNWQLSLYNLHPENASTTGSSTIDDIMSHTGSFTETATVIDSSRLITGSINFTSKAWDVIPGTIENGPYVSHNDVELSGSATGSIGIFYPNHGMIVLAGSKMDSNYGFATNRNVEKDGLNAFRLHESIKAVTDNGETDASGDVLAFYGRSAELKYNKIYFVRVKNNLFNYTNNPTFISGSDGVILDTLANQERAYFTSIGLYNNRKELLAVGKISKPMISACNTERLFKVKIGH